MKHWRDEQAALTQFSSQGESILHKLRNHGSVSQDGSFGVASRPARVHLIQVVVLHDETVRRRRWLLYDPLMIVVPTCSCVIKSHETFDR